MKRERERETGQYKGVVDREVHTKRGSAHKGRNKHRQRFRKRKVKRVYYTKRAERSTRSDRDRKIESKRGERYREKEALIKK